MHYFYSATEQHCILPVINVRQWYVSNGQYSVTFALIMVLLKFAVVKMCPLAVYICI